MAYIYDSFNLLQGLWTWIASGYINVPSIIMCEKVI